MIHDPALDRWAAMRENVYQHYKFTRTITRQTVALGLVLPIAIYAVAAVYDNKYDWAGKLKGSSLLRNPPAPAPAKDDE
ncbi:uncharacterized protein LOC62_02G002431 [Vanrija pseudolonga]|uniref:NADH dehydrogenase [ubiquinone] 1 beta subcomplex subunit 4 n=1 Tax=Vanrija pseudolonga TaxID=143232 RepID=A0AAF0Y2L9_9TREE|nr:hypothetical protein LOC62_02G002431 [Vanrija pseudolonga]